MLSSIFHHDCVPQGHATAGSRLSLERPAISFPVPAAVSGALSLVAIPHSFASNLVEERRRCSLRGISGHGCARVRIVRASTAGHDDTAKSMDSLILRAAPVRMLARVCAPAQTPEVEVLRVAEEVPELHEEAVGYVSEPKGSDVLTPALRAAGTHGVFRAGLCRFEPRG